MVKTSRHLFLFLIVLSLSSLLACSNSSPAGPGDKTTSATVSVDVHVLSQAQSKASQKFLGTINDITSITVDVKKGGTFLITGQQLTYSGGIWSGILENLPIDPSLTFIGHAFNASAVEIFTGETVQAMTGTNDSITILMAPVDDGVPVMVPRITKIIVPAEIVTSSTVTIGIWVEASSGETLNHATTAASGGGSFSPSSGTIDISPPGTTGTLVLSYSAPSTAGTYTHAIRLVNSQGNWVETNFTAVVSGTASPSMNVQFAPVITAIGVQRSGSDVIFTAVVSDTTPTTLTYEWGFAENTHGDDPGSGLSFVDSTTNPAVLQGYDETKSGNLGLRVRNGAGGATIVSYYIAPGLLPDNVVVTQGAQWAQTVTAGNNISKINSVSTASDGSAYAAGYIYGTGTYDFGNGITSAGTYTGNNIVLVKYNSSGVTQWARTVTAGNNVSYFNSVSVASDGSVYAAGYINGTGAFNFGNSIISAGTYTGSNVLLVKYNSSGVAQWARTITSAPVKNSYFSSVSVAPDGSVYAAGYIDGTSTYYFGNAIATGTNTGHNIVLVKYNSSGVAQWAKTVTGGGDYSRFDGVSVASDGSVYAGGRILGTSSYDFGNSVTAAAGGANAWNIILVKYNSSGVAQWARSVISGGDNSMFLSVSAASDGSVYAAGYTDRPTTYDFGNSVTIRNPYNGNNILLVKYNSSGVAQWAETVTAGSSYSYFYSVSVASDGSVYAAGSINGTGTYDFGNSVTAAGTNSGSNLVLVKYNSSGSAQWAQTVTVGSSNSEFLGVSVGSDGSVCAAGSIWGTSTYEFGNGVTAAGTYSGSNVVLVKYY
jgi:hypothetical protein